MPKPLPLALAALLTLTPLLRADDEAMKPMTSSGDDEMMMSSPASTRPAPRPATTAAAQPGPRAPLFDRLRDYADRLDLSEDQRRQLQSLAQSAREKSRQAFRDAAGDRDKARARLNSITRDTFERVRAILNPDQQRKLRQLMADGANAPEMRELNADQMQSNEGFSRAQSAKKESLNIGEPVDPATLRLQKLDGKPLALSALKGKPVVLVFGSWSCPSFRDHVKDLDTLARQYTVKAHFVTIYTREAHPTGGWEVERNKEQEIAIPAHKDEEERAGRALQVRKQTGLSTTIAIDTMDDQAVRAFDAFPNGVVILGRDGSYVARQKWLEPRRLRSLLDPIIDTKATQSSTKPVG